MASENKKIRILYVHNSADSYGASRSLLRLMTEYNHNKFEPFVILPEEGFLSEHIRKKGVNVTIHPLLSVITRDVSGVASLLKLFLGFPVSVMFLYFFITKNKIKLVHTNTGVIASPGPAAWLARVPHVWHLRDWFQEFQTMWKYYSRYILFFSQKIICVSGPIAAQFPPNKKVTVINNGINLSEFDVNKSALRNEFREKYGLGNGVVVGTAGRIKLVRKGQEVFVKAAGILKKEGISATYLIVGAPFKGNESHLEKLKELIQELDLRNDVTFTGEISEMKSAYCAMDVFVLPSSQPEPFGGVVIEAMALGVPVIATGIGGSIEQVGEGETGYLFEPGNEFMLAEKMKILIQDEQKRHEFSKQSVERIKAKFLIGGMLQKFEAVYDTCLNGKI